MFQGLVAKINGLTGSNAVVSLIFCGYSDDVVLNTYSCTMLYITPIGFGLIG